MGKCKASAVGGQAVIEGVLMKNGNNTAIAVRRQNKTITVRKETLHPLSKKHKFLKWPFIRGTVNLIEMLVIGIKALNYSANESMGEEDEKINGREFVITTIVALGLAIGLFVVLPLFLARMTRTEGILFNMIDGVIRIAVFLIYVYAISFMADVKKMFQYHGAEHKTVHCYENEKELTVKNVKKYPTAHRRCGTTFLLIVLIVSIIAFSFIISESLWIKLVGRILLFPVIAGLSYELLKLGAKFPDNKLITALVYPGMLVQSMTTKEPTGKQIEVAIKALKAVV